MYLKMLIALLKGSKCSMKLSQIVCYFCRQRVGVVKATMNGTSECMQFLVADDLLLSINCCRNTPFYPFGSYTPNIVLVDVDPSIITKLGKIVITIQTTILWLAGSGDP